jgi:hypothetical protein
LHETRERSSHQTLHGAARFQYKQRSRRSEGRGAPRWARHIDGFLEKSEYVRLCPHDRVNEYVRVCVSAASSLDVQAKPTLREINNAPTETRHREHTRCDRRGRNRSRFFAITSGDKNAQEQPGRTPHSSYDPRHSSGYEKRSPRSN